MSIAIRPATPGDVEVMAEFNRLMAEETEGKRLDADVLRAGVAAVLADAEKGFYLLACQDERVIGQVMVTREWSDWRNGWWWWLQSVYIVADARRQGVFQNLYEHVIRLAKSETRVLGLRLYVEQHNHAALATYRKLGMAPTDYLMFDCSLA